MNPDGACEVWWARPAAQPVDHLVLLDRAERERLAAYRRQADRDRFSTGCLLLRRVLAKHLDVDPADVPIDRTCPDCARPHGKPRVAGELPVEVSVSHSGDRVLLAVHPFAAVGVDVERINPHIDVLDMVPRVLSEGERPELQRCDRAGLPAAFTRYWVRKEAVVKATGEGMRAPLTAITVTAPDHPPAVLDWYGGPVHLADLDVGSRYRAAVACLSADPVPVRVRDAAGASWD